MKKRYNTKIQQIFLVIALFFVGFQGYAAPSSNGIIGAGLLVQPMPQYELPDLFAEAFFASQIDLSQSLLIRTEFSVFTDSIIGDNFLKDIPAYFSLNELSLTYVGNLGTISQLASVFIGETDPIGSDLFLRRLLGFPVLHHAFLKQAKAFLALNSIPCLA